jgi:hypothetical protein
VRQTVELLERNTKFYSSEGPLREPARPSGKVLPRQGKTLRMKNVKL